MVHYKMIFKRRDFLKYIASLTSAIPPLPSIFSIADKTVFAKETGNRVVITKRPGVFSSPTIVSPEIVNSMLSDGICLLTGCKTPEDAWRSLFKLNERIGIKINSLGGRKICTHPELAYGVAKHLTNIGIRPDNIIIFDRLTNELKRAGYKIQKNSSSVNCFGTDSDYELTPEFSGTIGTCFSRILTQNCDAIISIPVLKDHDLSGVSLSLKNFYGVIHNPNKYHDNGCDPFIADLNCHPFIKNKLRLVIIDAITGQYNGGPAFKSQWAWPYSGLILGRDPVAVDLVGSRVIEQKRKQNGLPTLKEAGREPIHIQSAAKRKLGTGNLNKIEVLEL